MPAIATAADIGAEIAPRDSASAIQPYLNRIIDQVTEFTLDNGMQFMVLERHQAPVVSFMTYADVGAANEADGKTGLAHYLEHLAFKGTTRIGARDYPTEKQLLAQMDQVFDQLKAARAADQTEAAAELEEKLATLQAEAATYIEQNEMGQAIEQAGGVGLNATTSADATRYFYSLPSNKLELWMSLESDRFLDPVFREFFEEKSVVLEERKLRVDNSPIGTMVEQFLGTAFEGHPYQRPIIGYADDLYDATRADVQQFFDTYYGPNNLTIAIVGDVDPVEVKQLAETYFGRFVAKPEPPAVEILQPAQTEPRELTVRLQSQPWYFEGYHRPEFNHPDHVVHQIIGSLLTSGRTSRLYQSLVEEQKIALNVVASSGFPGNKYPSLVLLYALPAPGHTIDEVAQSLDAELERLKTEPVADAELDRIKTQSRASLLRTLASNRGLASLLAEYQVKTGDWRNLFNELAAIDAVTAADVQRVAQATFQPQNQTIGRLLPLADEG
ncbi:MAG: insulinase family protein [Cyanothece sp. SIO1E1]|nr:insulinase family protein [Cyanothece sp. SIO1E1]